MDPVGFLRPPHQAQVWFLRIDDMHSMDLGCLSEDERMRALRFRMAPDRVSFAGTRVLLRTLLGRYSGRNPSSLQFHYTPHGKPFLPDDGTNLSFNVSRRYPYSLVVVTNGPSAGIDIEKMQSDINSDEIALQNFSAREIDWLNTRTGVDKMHGFFRSWVIKEAVLKGDGRGLSVPLREIDVNLPDSPSADLRWGSWRIDELELTEGWLGAVALAATTQSIVTFPQS